MEDSIITYSGVSLSAVLFAAVVAVVAGAVASHSKSEAVRVRARDAKGGRPVGV